MGASPAPQPIQEPKLQGPRMSLDSTEQKQSKNEKKTKELHTFMVGEKVKYSGHPGSKNPRNQVGVIQKVSECFLTIAPKDGGEFIRQKMTNVEL